MKIEKKNLLGIGITNALNDDILEYIFTSVQKKGEKFYIVTPNPEMLVLSQQDKEFASVLNQARIALPDGIGLMMAGKILGKPFTERITGVDFLEVLCKESVKRGKKDVRNPISIGFLGAGSGVAEKAAECLVRKYPGLLVRFIGEEWGKDGFDRARKYAASSIQNEDKREILNSQHIIPNTPIDILFVAFGFPKQELWMHENLGKLPVKVMMGVGGAFDYISGSVPRAPLFLRNLGLEWLYRLLRQPWRIKRQRALGKFILLVLRAKLG